MLNSHRSSARRASFMLFPVLALASLPLAADTPLKLTPGLWSIQLTILMTAGAPPAAIEKLPPAQRAAAAKAFAAQNGKPIEHTSKDCVTAKDIKDGALFGDEEGCTVKVTTSTATEWSGTQTCTTDDGTRTGQFTIKAPSPTQFSVKGSLVEQEAGSERRGTMTATARWLATSCAGAD
jgi:hypothetical protein